MKLLQKLTLTPTTWAGYYDQDDWEPPVTWKPAHSFGPLLCIVCIYFYISTSKVNKAKLMTSSSRIISSEVWKKNTFLARWNSLGLINVHVNACQWIPVPELPWKLFMQTGAQLCLQETRHPFGYFHWARSAVGELKWHSYIQWK